jgi:hypothetical protein
MPAIPLLVFIQSIHELRVQRAIREGDFDADGRAE